MLFNSYTYVLFLPIVFILYWNCPQKYRQVLLLIASYYFYMSWNVKYLSIIVFTTIISYVAALYIDKTVSEKKKHYMAVLTVIICLVILGVFKYYNFVIENISQLAALLSIEIHPITSKLLLPVGISFYTFQTISYVIDVYRGKIIAERNFISYATFVSFFPQLVAGPIERTTNLLPQIKGKHNFTYVKAIMGAKLILWGYYKKLVIADNIAPYVDAVYRDVTCYNGIDLAIAIFLFAIQIYCDFSGYSDIAIGTAKLLDIDLMTNFKNPYFSSSIKEFWSRWHISLSTWFRDYVYIPLGGNRCSKIRQSMNVMITFLVSGLWHGANWTFVLWGGVHGCAQILENVLEKSLNIVKKNNFFKFVRIIAVFGFCNFAWVFFRAKSLGDAWYVLCHWLDGITNIRGYLDSSLISKYELMFILIYIIILMIYDYIEYHLNDQMQIIQCSKIIQWIIYIVLGLMILFGSKKGVPAEFVYFQF